MYHFRTHIGIHIYWFIDRWGRQWNDFKDFIGHPSDPKWLRWIVDKAFYPHEHYEELRKEVAMSIFGKKPKIGSKEAKQHLKDAKIREEFLKFLQNLGKNPGKEYWPEPTRYDDQVIDEIKRILDL